MNSPGSLKGTSTQMSSAPSACCSDPQLCEPLTHTAGLRPPWRLRSTLYARPWKWPSHPGDTAEPQGCA
eukprot:4285947-Prorocentrum_lima.AAC.1